MSGMYKRNILAGGVYLNKIPQNGVLPRLGVAPHGAWHEALGATCHAIDLQFPASILPKKNQITTN